MKNIAQGAAIKELKVKKNPVNVKRMSKKASKKSSRPTASFKY
jgi:hypothetical protein